MNEIHKIILKHYISPISTVEQKVAWVCSEPRIGSIRYIAWVSAAFTMITGLFYTVIYLLNNHSNINYHFLSLVNRGLFVVYLIILAIACSYISMKRLQDFNANKWWGLIMFLPAINVLMFTILILIPGNKTNNKFGKPPSATTKLEWLLVGWFCLMAIVFLWGIILVNAWLSLSKTVAPQVVNYHSSDMIKQIIL